MYPYVSGAADAALRETGLKTQVGLKMCPCFHIQHTHTFQIISEITPLPAVLLTVMSSLRIELDSVP